MPRTLKTNALLQFSLVTLVTLTGISLCLSALLTRQLSEYLVATHASVYPRVLETILDDHPEVLACLEEGSPLPETAVRNFLGDLTTFGAVFQVRLWNRDGLLVWDGVDASATHLFSHSPQRDQALRGDVVTRLLNPATLDASLSPEPLPLLQITAPLLHEGRILAAVELVEADRALFRSLASARNIIWSLVAATGIILYSTLFAIFYNARARERRAVSHLLKAQEAIILALSRLAETRDDGTGRHLERTASYLRILAEELRIHPEYRHYLSDEYIASLVQSAPLHDIGKVGIPDAILRKPDRLTPEEHAIVRTHSETGAGILGACADKLPFRSFLHLATHMARHHHERWNGAGYPHGLREQEIPLSARLMALADVYDALRTRRHYKDPLPHPHCVEIIRSESGRHFDPHVVQAFLRREQDFARISEDIPC